MGQEGRSMGSRSSAINNHMTIGGTCRLPLNLAFSR